MQESEHVPDDSLANPSQHSSTSKALLDEVDVSYHRSGRSSQQANEANVVDDEPSASDNRPPFIYSLFVIMACDE